MRWKRFAGSKFSLSLLWSPWVYYCIWVRWKEGARRDGAFITAVQVWRGWNKQHFPEWTLMCCAAANSINFSQRLHWHYKMQPKANAAQRSRSITLFMKLQKTLGYLTNKSKGFIKKKKSRVHLRRWDKMVITLNMLMTTRGIRSWQMSLLMNSMIYLQYQ